MLIGALKKVLGASYIFCIMKGVLILIFFCSLSYKIKIVMVENHGTIEICSKSLFEYPNMAMLWQNIYASQSKVTH